MIAPDPNNPEITDEQIKSRKTFAEAFPDLAEGIKRGRGQAQTRQCQGSRSPAVGS